MLNWLDHIFHQVRTHPQRPALVMEDRVVTYEMMNAGIERCARRIVGLDLVRHGQIAVLIDSPIRQIIVCLALFRIGVQFVSLEHGQSGIAALAFPAVLGDASARKVVNASTPFIDVTDDWFSVDQPAVNPLPQGFTRDEEIYCASFTSGTTGTPKLIPRRIDGITRRILVRIDTNWTRVLDMPGLSTNWGFMTAFASLATGRTVCFAESPFQAVRMIELFGIDFIVASTEQLLALTRVARKTGAQMPSLKTIWFGGTVPTRILLEAAMISLCNNIICGYGASEIGLMTQASARELLSRPGLVGHVIPGVSVRIVDAQGHPCPAGQAGLVQARLDEDGIWKGLGDLGWIAPDGALYVIGRASEADARTPRVSPVHEIEQIMRLEWDVADAAAVLIDEDAADVGPQIGIAVVGNTAVTAEQVEPIVRARGIAGRIRIYHVPTIPHGANGKVSRAELKTMLLKPGAKSSG